MRNPFLRLLPHLQPFSPITRAKHSRLRGATVIDGVCPYNALV